MPIPSLSSATTSRSQLSRANSVSTRPEVLLRPHNAASTAILTTRQRPGDDHNVNAAAPSRIHKRSDSEQTSSLEPRKRSFLPQRGLPKHVGRSVGIAGSDALLAGPPTHAASSDGIKQTRPRPRSLYQAQSTHREATGMDGTPSAPQLKDTNTKPPGSVGLSRTQSLRRPGIPLQSALSPATGGRTHTRTNSASTPVGNWTDEEKSARPVYRTEKSKHSLATSAHAKTSSSAAVEAANNAVRTSARLDALKRSASTRLKPISSHSRAMNSKPNDSVDRPSAEEGRGALKQEARKPARPVFSTLQQHFTPRKTGKAPTSTFLHAPEPLNHVLPPEVVSLQNELLQLHLMHESSASTNEQWEASVQQKLQIKFDEVVTLYQTMQRNERDGQEQKNILALREWNGSNPTSSLVEHIQALSSPLHELPSLLDPGGRYSVLVEEFTKWSSQADQVWSDRTEPSGRRGGVHSLEGLSEVWRGEHAAMTRKLTAFAHYLNALPLAENGPSITYIVLRCQSLVNSLLSELQIMQATEFEVIAREKLWVEARLRAIAEDIIDVQFEVEDEAWRL